MYKVRQLPTTGIKRNVSTVGETIEDEVYKMVYEKNIPSAQKSIIFQEKKEGVQPAYNVRTDKFDIALDAIDAVTKYGRKTARAKDEKKGQESGEKTEEKSWKSPDGQESIQAS